MAAPTHNLVVKTGQYTDGSGQQKNRWQKVGSVFRHDDGGTSIKIDCMPVGVPDWDGWVSVFPIDQDQAGGSQGQQQQQQSRQSNGYRNEAQRQPPPRQTHQSNGRTDFDDHIPF